MTRQVKIFHISDIHLGTYIGKLQPIPNAALSLHQSVFDVFRALDKVIEDAQAEQPDFILITGDLFHRTINSRVILRSLAERLARMTQIAPTIILVGNHDLIGNAHMLSDYAELPINNLYIVDIPTPLSFETKDGIPVTLVCAGWPDTTMLAEEDETDQLNQMKTSTKQKLQWMINNFAKETAENIPAGTVKVFAGHGMMTDFYSSEEVELLGGEDFTSGIMKDDLMFYPANFTGYDYIALGHIHLRSLKADKRTAYPGSLYPVNFGESKTPHGYVVATIDADTKELFLEPRDIVIRPYTNFFLKTSKFSSEDQIVTHILTTAPPDKERFVRVKFIVDNNGLDVNPASFVEVLEQHYGFLTIEKTYAADLEIISNDPITWHQGDTVLSITKRYLQGEIEKGAITPPQADKAIITLRSYINKVSQD